jgi:hypothetical protein
LPFLQPFQSFLIAIADLKHVQICQRNSKNCNRDISDDNRDAGIQKGVDSEKAGDECQKNDKMLKRELFHNFTLSYFLLYHTVTAFKIIFILRS